MNYYIDAIEAWKSGKGKPRGKWKLGELSNEQLSEVLRKLLNRESYRSVREFVAKEFEVSIESDRSLSEFFSGVKHFLGAARRRSALAGTKLAGPLTPEEQEEIDAANLRLLKTVANEKLDNPETDPQEIAIFARAILHMEDQSLSRQDLAVKLRRLAVLEDKEKQATEAKKKLTAVAKKGGLTKETLQQIEEAAKLL